MHELPTYLLLGLGVVVVAGMCSGCGPKGHGEANECELSDPALRYDALVEVESSTCPDELDRIVEGRINRAIENPAHRSNCPSGGYVGGFSGSDANYGTCEGTVFFYVRSDEEGVHQDGEANFKLICVEEDESGTEVVTERCQGMALLEFEPSEY